jgi:hypothetical protein
MTFRVTLTTMTGEQFRVDVVTQSLQDVEEMAPELFIGDLLTIEEVN